MQNRRTVGPIGLPENLTPRDFAKHKNESMFTSSLISGDAAGYGHIAGGPQANRKPNQKTRYRQDQLQRNY